MNNHPYPEVPRCGLDDREPVGLRRSKLTCGNVSADGIPPRLGVGYPAGVARPPTKPMRYHRKPGTGKLVGGAFVRITVKGRAPVSTRTKGAATLVIRDRHMSSTFEPDKIPTKWAVADTLLYTANGKVQRHVLREQLAAGGA